MDEKNEFYTTALRLKDGWVEVQQVEMIEGYGGPTTLALIWTKALRLDTAF